MDLTPSIKTIRKLAKLTQADFAAKLGITRHTVMNWENGTTKPSASEMEGIVRIFNIATPPTDYIFSANYRQKQSKHFIKTLFRHPRGCLYSVSLACNSKCVSPMCRHHQRRYFWRMATVKFYLKRPKKDGKIRGDEVNIIAKFTISGKERFEKKTQQKIEPKYWNAKSQCVTSKHADHQSINDYLADFKRDLTNLYRDNWRLSFEQFKMIAIADHNKTKTLPRALRQWLQLCRREKDSKTLAVYMTLLRQLRDYKSARRIRIDFEHIDWNFYDAFRAMLFARGCLDSTVNKNVDRMKAFLTWAEKRSYPVNPVFKEWTKTIRRKEKPVKLLTIDELQRLEAADNLTHEERIGRDFLCLESRTGQRISDLVRFNVRDYNNNRWTFFRKKGSNIKTKKVTVSFVGFCAPALSILARHNFELPTVPEQTINGWIKKACERIGMTQEIPIVTWRHGKRLVEMKRKCDVMSTHAGRRTFITLALQFLPPKVVMDLAGIDSFNTLKQYEGDSEPEILESHLMNMDRKLIAI